MESEDYTTYLVDQAKSYASAFHDFRISMEPDADQIHVFVEGNEDVIYYLPEIRRRANGRAVFSYRCGGKRAVIETKKNVIEAGYEQELCLFFVDRDYDDLFGCQVESDEKLLVTETYSIENHLTDCSALEAVLCDLVSVKKGDKTYAHLTESIQSCQNSFRNKILPILAVSLAMREAGKKPNYNNLTLKNVFSIEMDGTVKRKTGCANEVFKAYGLEDPKELHIRSILSWLKKLKALPSIQSIRGKYELWFFRNCIIYFVKDAVNKKHCPYKLKIGNNINADGFVEAVAGRVPLPNYIGNFLDAHLS